MSVTWQYALSDDGALKNICDVTDVFTGLKKFFLSCAIVARLHARKSVVAIIVFIRYNNDCDFLLLYNNQLLRLGCV